MMDPGYITAGYVVTAATVSAYAWSIGTRTRQVARALSVDGRGPATTSPASADATDDEG
jgi:hypothetical protein